MLLIMKNFGNSTPKQIVLQNLVDSKSYSK